MTALISAAIVERLLQAGLNLSLAPAGGLAVTPSSHLTAELRDLIRSSKPLLIRWLTAADEGASGAPDQLANPLAWKELAAAYHAHHFDCRYCIAAGRSSQNGPRCRIGAALWGRYTG